ncbi:hypothetical protein M5K25_027762 [Dendrobium thyrsiflorum]|uniref:Protein kinase domain-containing protein n=1 Tax=Dendrobium thyrsiflorum TaxID=117978 RepID=A0ABD0TUP9_DENTH
MQKAPHLNEEKIREAERMPSLLELFFCFIFLSYTEIIISHGKGSCSSSCGSLQNIRYPFQLREIIISHGKGSCSSSCGSLLNIRYLFHLRGDPAECGSSDFELNCEGNNTILDIHQRKYYIKDISYRDYKIMLVDVGLSHDNCGLPEIIISHGKGSCSSSCGSLLNIRYPFHLRGDPAECGSSDFELNCEGNNTILDIHQRKYYVKDISYRDYKIMLVDVGLSHDNCGLSGGSIYPVGENDELSKFDLLKLGFRLNWHPPINSATDAIYICAKTAGLTKFFERDSSNVINGVKVMTKYDLRSPFHFEFNFMACLHEKRYHQSILTFYLTTLIIIVLDISLLILVLLLIGRFLFAPLCVLSFLAYNLFKLIKPVDIVERFLQNQKALSPSRYTYNEIIIITSNFKEKLGQGGFGFVYKGRIPGSYFVAVKMLGKSMGDGEDFINEVSTIGRIHHVNVVQLVGFCVEGSYRALVYEYMPNGSLDKYIFNSNKENRFLNMEKLLEIAKSVAKGLHYLHQGCNMRILHFDIKPHNILLDHKFTPKISDFGLAKLYPKGHSLVSISAARGTIGYIAPELISRSFGTISHKSDVYSFGMLLMDMAGGRRHFDLKAHDSSQLYYPSWIYDKLKKMELSKNFDIFEIDDLERKLCKVGLSCIQTRPIDRPSMITVMEMLESDVDSLQMPPKPFFSSLDQVSSLNFSMDYSECELSRIL